MTDMDMTKKAAPPWERIRRSLVRATAIECELHRLVADGELPERWLEEMEWIVEDLTELDDLAKPPAPMDEAIAALDEAIEELEEGILAEASAEAGGQTLIAHLADCIRSSSEPLANAITSGVFSFTFEELAEELDKWNFAEPATNDAIERAKRTEG